MKKCVLFLLAILSVSVQAQPNSTREMEYFRQLQRLKDGVLIVCLPADPVKRGIQVASDPDGIARSEQAEALYKAVNEFYRYSKVYFFIGEPEEFKAESSFNARGERFDPGKDNPHLFSLSIARNDSIVGYCRFEILQKDGSWAGNGSANQDQSVASGVYGQRMASFDPENISKGGLVIQPMGGPVHRPFRKKKRIATYYIYRSRLNSFNPPGQRFQESVDYLQRKLDNEYQSYLKKWG